MSRTYILKTKEISKSFEYAVNGTFLMGQFYPIILKSKPERNPQPVKNRHSKKIFFGKA